MFKLFASLLLCAALSGHAMCEQFTLLHALAPADGVGSVLFCNLAIDGPTIYGTTASNGSLFKMNTDGSGIESLHAFDTNANGVFATGPLTLIGSTLYGTTSQGGITSSDGTAYKLNTDGTGFSVLHSFVNNFAAPPVTGVVDSGSALYGTTGYYDTNHSTVYRMNLDGSSFVRLKAFDGSTGEGEMSALTLAGSTLYGTTGISGPSSAQGTLYKINSDGSGFGILHGFQGGASDGARPSFGPLVLNASTLFGTTKEGGASGKGTVFQINTDGTGFQLLHSFAGGADDGADPESGLTLVGSRLYGTTFSGGASDFGTLFRINLDGSDFQMLHSFDGSDGWNPQGGLTLNGTTLFGTAAGGGPNGLGTVFALSVPEPASAVLAAVSLLGLAAWGWRFRRSSSSSVRLGPINVS